MFTIGITQTLFTLAVVFGVKTIRTMQEPVIKKRLKYFLIGVCMFELVVWSSILRNAQYLAALGAVGSVLLLVIGFCIVPGGIFVYYSVGRNIK